MLKLITHFLIQQVAAQSHFPYCQAPGDSLMLLDTVKMGITSHDLIVCVNMLSVLDVLYGTIQLCDSKQNAVEATDHWQRVCGVCAYACAKLTETLPYFAQGCNLYGGGFL